MARPTLDERPQHYRLTLCLRPGEDDDLIAWLDSLPGRGRASAVVAALRDGGVTAECNGQVIDEEQLADSLMHLFM